MCTSISRWCGTLPCCTSQGTTITNKVGEEFDKKYQKVLVSLFETGDVGNTEANLKAQKDIEVKEGADFQHFQAYFQAATREKSQCWGWGITAGVVTAVAITFLALHYTQPGLIFGGIGCTFIGVALHSYGSMNHNVERAALAVARALFQYKDWPNLNGKNDKEKGDIKGNVVLLISNKIDIVRQLGTYEPLANLEHGADQIDEFMRQIVTEAIQEVRLKKQKKEMDRKFAGSAPEQEQFLGQDELNSPRRTGANKDTGSATLSTNPFESLTRNGEE